MKTLKSPFEINWPLVMYTFFNQWQLVNFITLRNWKISSNFSSLIRIYELYCTALCNVQRRQSEDVFLDRYRLSVNTFFMVSNGHSEFRYIALHLTVVASAEASTEASPGRHGRRHWGWRGARWGRDGVSCRRFFPSWAEAGWLAGRVVLHFDFRVTRHHGYFFRNLVFE